MFLSAFVAAVFIVVVTVPSIFRIDYEPESSNRVKLGAARNITRSVEGRIDVKTEERATCEFFLL